MDAKTLTQIFAFLPPEQAVLLRGDHGIGKSQIVHALAKERGLPLIDVRASTMQEGDVVGYPDIESIKSSGVCTFALPVWFVTACKEPVVLFLDELNRGLIGVLNGMFQVVLDRELGHGPDGRPMRLHPETQVIAAVNVGGDYTVNEMDPALLSRFATYDFKPTVHDWLDWAETNGIDSLIVDFIRNHPEHLRPTREVEPNRVAPDQRAWARLDASFRHNGVNLSECGGNCPAMVYPVATGFVGVEAAAALKSFVDSYESVLTAEDVLDGWNKKLEKQVTEMSTEKRLALIEKVKNHAGDNEWTLSQAKKLQKMWNVLTGEQKMALFNGVMGSGNQNNIIKFHSLIRDELAPILIAAQNLNKSDK